MHHNVSNSGFPSLQLSCSKLKLPIPKAWRHFSIDDRTVKSWHVMTLGLWTIKRAMYVMIVMVMASFTLNLLIRWDVISAIDKNQCTHSIIASLLTCQEPAQALDGEALQAECCKWTLSPVSSKASVWFNKSHLSLKHIRYGHLPSTCIISIKLRLRHAWKVCWPSGYPKKKHHAKIKTFGASKFSSEAANGGGTGWHG